MKREYQTMMEHINVPSRLNERVLDAARQAPSRSRRGRLWKTAVCAACALALVVGSVRLRPESGEGGLPRLTCDFVLTAYAADLGETVLPNANGGLAFRTAGETGWDAARGYFTGCLFQVTGEGIETVSLSLDRGGFYRWEPEGEAETPLGSSVTEDYDSQRWYGFLVPGVEAAAWEADAEAAMRDSLDALDGAALSVSVTCTDGTTRQRDYLLAVGLLKTVPCEDGAGRILLPRLAGDDEAGYYGIYAVSETESRWLRWPVEGADTISLSNDYGHCQGPDGERFHAGIDIPAERGAPVLAAADGTVTETGFDPERGNYVRIDHGDGLTVLYAHCSRVDVAEGDEVTAGAVIAAVGSTGRSTGPHLHFEVRQDGTAQNPTAYFDADTRAQLRMG